MATNWYDPSSGGGFFNSPQDFLFKGNDSTWYGQGPAGQADAGRMPTAADFYFNSPTQPANSQPAMAPINFGGPQRPEGYNAPGYSRMSGGGSINLGSPVSARPGPLWQRYSALQANPEMAAADPAYQFLFKQGTEALNRTAAAKRMRFAGKTMLDAQEYGQGLAANNLKQVLGELRAGAGAEDIRMQREAEADYSRASGEALQADPYGHARRAASQFPTFADYLSSASRQANPAALQAQWDLGRRLLSGMRSV